MFLSVEITEQVPYDFCVSAKIIIIIKKGVWFSLIPNTPFMQRLDFKSYYITAYDGVNRIISLSYFVEAGNKMELVYEGSFWKIIRQQIPAPFFYIASSS